jgi:hypothetical protein
VSAIYSTNRRAKVQLACDGCPKPIEAGSTFMKTNDGRRFHHWCDKLRRQDEVDARWRGSEFVNASANWGDRGRMRGSTKSPDAVLHRSNCRMLNRELRAHSEAPAHVHATTVPEFLAPPRYGTQYQEHKICGICCRDIKEGK